VCVDVSTCADMESLQGGGMLAVLGHCSSPATCSHPIRSLPSCNALPAIGLHYLHMTR